VRSREGLGNDASSRDWGDAASDLTGDGVIEGADLGALLGAWQVCP
jgi:hypothetical protein